MGAKRIDLFLEIAWLTNEKLKDHSAYYFTDKIKTPLLIIHGTKDDRAPIVLAEKFAKIRLMTLVAMLNSSSWNQSI